MPSFKALDQADVAGKTVLLRGDLNVPFKAGAVTDGERLDRLAPTILELSDKGAKVAILAHFGRPKGKRATEYSLAPVVPALSAALGGRAVAFAEDCIGETAKAAIDALPARGIIVLENTRFHPGEEKNDPALAAAMAALGDLFVSDAFSAAHRAHASTEAIAKALPAYAGRLMQAELEALGNALEAPVKPVLAFVGGAKISTKLELLGNLVEKVDQLVLGGGMANTFLAAQGVDVGKSLCEHDMLDNARAITVKAQAAGCEIVLPVDGMVAAEFAENTPSDAVDVGAIPADRMMLDVGPKTIEALKTRVDAAKTVVWNGPLGAFEIAPFDRATSAVAAHVAAAQDAGTLLSVAGGGDTVAALAKAGVKERFGYVSTAGGAFLEWLEGKTLPGVAALEG